MPLLEHQVTLARAHRDNWYTTRDNIVNARIRYAKVNTVRWFEKCVAARESIGADLVAAWQYVLNRVRNTERAMDWGLLETSLVCDTHRAMFENSSFPTGMTPPGELSDRPRYSDLEGRTRHWYPVPKDMGEALASLLDSYNTRYDSCRGRYDAELFRTCAWFLCHFLALHPFADGNGRMAQLLCSYAMAQHHPFPVPVCDENDYLPSLLEAQSTGNLDALATCVASSVCRAWQIFDDFLRSP